MVGVTFQALIASTAAAGAFVGLLDTYTNATCAYSFRKLRAAYAGSAVRIRRASDDAEIDVGFEVDGDFDTATAATHIAATTGHIVTWYDQSGNGLDVTHATEANQPGYSATGFGSLNMPTATFSGSQFLLRASVPHTVFGAGTAVTVMSAFQTGDTNNWQSLFGWNSGDGANLLIILQQGGAFTCRFDFGTNVANDAGGSMTMNGGSTGPTIDCVGAWYRNGSNQTMDIQGGGFQATSTLTRNADLSSATPTLALGALSDGSIPWIGQISEWIVWPTYIGV